jgi:hypothetical protein
MMIKKFRKKPVVIEAMQFDGSQAGINAVKEWVGAKAVCNMRGTLALETLEGRMDVATGAWVIKGVRGEFYACRKDIFEETYEGTE